ncbi:hypothetical protein C8J25_101616 [Sphingomonas faeni]|uniref:DUF2155 domain-containing protein n=1 Tax=Sphingomonas faeni TaxID=185950 RepID=A0A2T5UC97_9SPHN|nr:hypothetical protein C8J25_101616 [Sphingomonas faeni]
MRWLAAAVLVVALAVGGWFGYRAITTPATKVAAVQQDLPGADEQGNSSIETIDTGAAAIANGGTPMAQRVAVLGLLNKRNGETREVRLKPGQATRMGDVVLRLRACEQTAPWEQEQLTGAFVQVLVRGVDTHWRRTFSGWLYKERPALNAVQHPIYDVWTKSCAMTFPETGPDTAPPAEALPAKRSSARKSPAAEDTPPPEDGLSAPSSAAPSNAT